jgi:hypothetical protein
MHWFGLEKAAMTGWCALETANDGFGCREPSISEDRSPPLKGGESVEYVRLKEPYHPYPHYLFYTRRKIGPTTSGIIFFFPPFFHFSGVDTRLVDTASSPVAYETWRSVGFASAAFQSPSLVAGAGGLREAFNH